MQSLLPQGLGKLQNECCTTRESTNERNLDDAKRIAHDLLIEANVRKKLNAAPITRTFKDIARQAIIRMEKLIADGDGKSMYKEYISIIEHYLIKFFGSYKIDNITHQLLEEFDAWRIQKRGCTAFCVNGAAISPWASCLRTEWYTGLMRLSNL